MDDNPEVRQGFWGHHGQAWFSVYQFTISHQRSEWIAIGIGILLGLVCNPLAFLLTRIFHEWPRYSRPRNRPTAFSGVTKESNLVDHPPEDQDSGSQSSPETIRQLPRSEGWERVRVQTVLILVLIACTIIGALTDLLPQDTMGKSSSTKCGAWGLISDASSRLRARDDLFQAQKERRAGEYERNCYHPNNILNPDRCKFFPVGSISSKPFERGQDCELGNGSYCFDGLANGRFTAVRFTTGRLDSSMLGLVTKKRPKFRLTSKFVPLDMNLSPLFIQPIASDDYKSDSWHEYNLGERNEKLCESYCNVTHVRRGNDFSSAMPGYAMDVYQSTPGRDDDYWKPKLPLLERPADTFLTLMLIASGRIFYTLGSNDPIFPSQQTKDGRYRNFDPRARALLSLDWAEVCTADERHCSPSHEVHPERGVEYEFVRLALNNTSTFQSVFFRGGNALQAQAMLADYRSPKLSDTHWINEAAALWGTKLARIQHEAYWIDQAFRNRDVSEGDYEDQTIHEFANNKLCGHYALQLPSGMTNINVVLMSLVIALILVASTGLETAKEFDDEDKPFFTKNWLIADLVFYAWFRLIYHCDPSLFNDFGYWIASLFRGFRHGIREGKSTALRRDMVSASERCMTETNDQGNSDDNSEERVDAESDAPSLGSADIVDMTREAVPVTSRLPTSNQN